MNLHLPLNIESSEDISTFKAEDLKELFRSLLKELMEASANAQMEENAHFMGKAQGKLEQLMSYIKSYRKHQAREDLCQLLRSQLDELILAEKELQRCAAMI